MNHSFYDICPKPISAPQARYLEATGQEKQRMAEAAYLLSGWAYATYDSPKKFRPDQVISKAQEQCGRFSVTGGWGVHQPGKPPPPSDGFRFSRKQLIFGLSNS